MTPPAADLPTLTSGDLALRPAVVADAPALLAMVREPAVAAWWGQNTLASIVEDLAGHHRFTIDPAAANESALRCYAAVGFRAVGTLRAAERAPDGTWRDAVLMDLLASDLEPAAA